MFGRLTPVAKNILIINAALLAIQSLLKVPLDEYFGLRVIFSENFAIYQLLTYMWLHAGVWHLFGNMISVLVFGPMLEQTWGSKRFLTFYLICGIGAGVFYGIADYIEKYPLQRDTQAFVEAPTPEKFEQFILNNKSFFHKQGRLVLGEMSDDYYENKVSDSRVISEVKAIYDAIINRGLMVGASGAVFGLLFAFGFLFPNMELMLLFPPVPIKAKYFVLFYGAYELYSEIQRNPNDNVAHLAHLGGMLIAFILLKVWQERNRY